MQAEDKKKKREENEKKKKRVPNVVRFFLALEEGLALALRDPVYSCQLH